MNTSLYIFTRDLRIEDNKALNAAIVNSDKVLPLFVFTEEQIDKTENKYFSNHAFAFMLQSLDDLQKKIRDKNGELFFFRGAHEKAIRQAHDEHNIQNVYFSYDVTPYAKKRAADIEKICNELEIECKQIHNHFLTNPGSVLTNDDSHYRVFTPFKRKAQEQNIDELESASIGEDVIYKTSTFDSNLDNLVDISQIESEFKGGRTAGLEQLKYIKTLANYERERNFVSQEGTSRLSPHVKFGTISSREFYWAVEKEFGKEHILISELYWRDFYAHIADAFPHIFGSAFNKKYDHVEWDWNEEHFDAWCEGKTGYPIVDAAMRQLNTTGWMHNRARMIVASFLTKHLRIDWRHGERYFAQKLVDYDPATNNGSWQWAASTGADSQPYFRIFNPWLQQEKFDPDAQYIKKYVSELEHLSAKEIHAYENRDEPVTNYVLPIVNHKEARAAALEMFKNI